MSRIYAGVLGFLAFLITLTRGLIDRQDAASLVPEACLAMAAFAAAGAVAGAIGDAAVREAVEQNLRSEIEAHQRQVNQKT